jgi:cyanophycinase-like exopeptidase
LAAAAAGNKVVFAGGSNNGVTATDMVDIFDITNNSWSSARLSEPRMNMSALVNGNLIYFTGGASSTSGSGLSNTVDVFDAVSGSWSVKKINKSGSSLQTAMFGNKMVVAGGNTGQNSNFLNSLNS